MSKYQKKNFLIGGLLAIVVVMGIAYAAFASNLTITGTSNISSTWDVEITGIELLDSSGATDNQGSPSYDNSNGLTATFNTNLTSPGDYAIYKIEVTNRGSLNAVLSSITGPTSNNNDITFYLNKNQNNQDITDTDRMIGTNDILNAAGDSNDLDVGYVYVTVLYREYEGQQTAVNKTATATVTLNFTQSNSAATVTPVTPAALADGTYYAFNTKAVYFNKEYCAYSDEYGCEGGYDTLEECLADYEGEEGYTCDKIPLQSYIGTETNWQNLNKNVFNKYVVSNGIITHASSCTKFSFINDPVCVEGSTDGSTYKYEQDGGNWKILNDLSSTFTANSGSCRFDSSDLNCYAGDLFVNARSSGEVNDYVRSTYQNCYVGFSGLAYCTE